MVGRGNPKLGGFRDFGILMLCYVLVDVLMISNMLKDVVGYCGNKMEFWFWFWEKKKVYTKEGFWN